MPRTVSQSRTGPEEPPKKEEVESGIKFFLQWKDIADQSRQKSELVINASAERVGQSYIFFIISGEGGPSDRAAASRCDTVGRGRVRANKEPGAFSLTLMLKERKTMGPVLISLLSSLLS